MAEMGVSATLTEERIHNQCTDISYPQVSGLKNKDAESSINSLIKKTVFSLIPSEGCDVYQEIVGKYTVGVNEKGILSIKFDVYTFRKHAANGLNVQKSITADLETGRTYQLHELFKNNSDYKIVISHMIQKQIAEKQLPILKEFTGITDLESYYLTKNSLVIYFQEITYFPHYAGIQEFPIPYSQIRSLIRRDSPIARLMQQH